MSQYKLTYFDFSGSRGEDCRLALFVAGVPFEDHRISQETWASLKADSPYGALPVLELAGKAPLAQSNAILTFVGQQHGLLPQDPWEAAQHLAVLESVEDLRAHLAPSGKLKDAEEKKQAREAFASGYLKQWSRALERQVRGPFLAGSAISVADIKVFQIMSSFKNGVLDHIPTSAFDDFPKLDALYAAVLKEPKIAEWKASH